MHLFRLASGCLTEVDGDIEAAMSLALQRHFALIQGIKEREVSADLGPGNAILFVPEEGGMAIRLERHPARTEEVEYPDIDLLGFEVVESVRTYAGHQGEQRVDVDLTMDTEWE